MWKVEYRLKPAKCLSLSSIGYFPNQISRLTRLTLLFNRARLHYVICNHSPWYDGSITFIHRLGLGSPKTKRSVSKSWCDHINTFAKWAQRLNFKYHAWGRIVIVGAFDPLSLSHSGIRKIANFISQLSPPQAPHLCTVLTAVLGLTLPSFRRLFQRVIVGLFTHDSANERQEQENKHGDALLRH